MLSELVYACVSRIRKEIISLYELITGEKKITAFLMLIPGSIFINLHSQ